MRKNIRVWRQSGGHLRSILAALSSAAESVKNVGYFLLSHCKANASMPARLSVQINTEFHHRFLICCRFNHKSAWDWKINAFFLQNCCSLASPVPGKRKLLPVNHVQSIRERDDNEKERLRQGSLRRRAQTMTEEAWKMKRAVCSLSPVMALRRHCRFYSNQIQQNSVMCLSYLWIDHVIWYLDFLWCCNIKIQKKN